MNYEFHPEAELEVIESAAWYESEVPGLGLEFGEEVERVIELLLENPELGAAVDGDIRHFVLRRFPFSVIYAVVGPLIYVRCARQPRSRVLEVAAREGLM